MTANWNTNMAEQDKLLYKYELYPKNRWWNTIKKQILINAKLQIGKRGKKKELTVRSPLRRRRSTMDCDPI